MAITHMKVDLLVEVGVGRRSLVALGITRDIQAQSVGGPAHAAAPDAAMAASGGRRAPGLVAGSDSVAAPFLESAGR